MRSLQEVISLTNTIRRKSHHLKNDSMFMEQVSDAHKKVTVLDERVDLLSKIWANYEVLQWLFQEGNSSTTTLADINRII